LLSLLLLSKTDRPYLDSKYIFLLLSSLLLFKTDQDSCLDTEDIFHN